MRIAFVSYEAPPDNPHGGISTYIGQAAAMLAARGHDVELFAGSRLSSDTHSANGFITHRIKAATHHEFASSVTHRFSKRHAERRFELLEAPEFQAEYRHLIDHVRDVPLVVKLHTPTFMIRRLMTEGWRYDQPAWRRRLWQLQNEFGIGLDPAARDDPEREAIALAASIAAPCEAIRRLITQEWAIAAERVQVVPYPFRPDHGLIHVTPGAERPIVAFLGRVEVRKGVVDLVDAFRTIRRQIPECELWFIGADGEAADGTPSMAEYLRARVPQVADSMRFIGRVERDQLPQLLQKAAVVVLPSLWENFPLACLESMAAARPTVVTAGTGMEEMADGGRAAVVVPARRPEKIADAVVDLLRNDGLRGLLATNARQRVLSAYGWDVIGPLQEQHYLATIARYGYAGRAR